MSDAATAAATLNARLVLADGTVFDGFGIGARGVTTGELCFTTGMTGYQETLTDPSFAGQLVTFTFPEVGICGANGEDDEAPRSSAAGVILRRVPTDPSNWRSEGSFGDWLESQGLIGIAGIDTRSLTRRIRNAGAMNAVIAHAETANALPSLAELQHRAAQIPDMEGLELALSVTGALPQTWAETPWVLGGGFGEVGDVDRHIVAIDYGAKENILRSLAGTASRVTVVRADTPADEILALNPDGIFLSNGPGDPAATSEYAAPILGDLIASGKPIFGICLGHQLLATALGAETEKLRQGHRGANQPVIEVATGRVKITSQNHGFAVRADSLPEGCEETEKSLFDGSNEGLRLTGRPVFSVQYHPEASPGPHDTADHFRRFAELIDQHRAT